MLPLASKVIQEFSELSSVLSFLKIKIPTKYGKLTTYFYAGGLSYAFNRPSEKTLLRYFKPQIGSTFVDVGANIGWYTLIGSKMVGLTGKVVAIEPEPKNFVLLQKNVKDNNLTNAIMINAALSDINGYEWLNLSSLPTEHSIMSTSSSHNIRVPSERLDDLLNKLKISHVDFLKIDVEDAEMRVLRGAKKTLTQGPQIIIECSNHENVQKYLGQYNYKTKRIDKFNSFCWR